MKREVGDGAWTVMTRAEKTAANRRKAFARGSRRKAGIVVGRRTSCLALVALALPTSTGCIVSLASRTISEGYGATLDGESVEPLLAVSAEIDESSGDLLVALDARLPTGARWSGEHLVECSTSDDWPAVLSLGIAGGVLTVAGAALFIHASTAGAWYSDDESDTVAVLAGSPLLAVGGAAGIAALIVGLLNDPDELSCERRRLGGTGALESMRLDRFTVIVTRPDGTSDSVSTERGGARVRLDHTLYECPPECPLVGPRDRSGRYSGPSGREILTIVAKPDPEAWSGAGPAPSATTTIEVPIVRTAEGSVHPVAGP